MLRLKVCRERKKKCVDVWLLHGNAAIRESTNDQLQGLIKKLALGMAQNMDLDKNTSSMPPPKFPNESVSWRPEVVSPPSKADRSIPLFIACIMSEISIDTVVSKELSNLPNKPKPFYTEEMRNAIRHLGVHLAVEDPKVKKY